MKRTFIDESFPHLFWLFQIAGWSLYALYDYLVYEFNTSEALYYNLFGSLITLITGFAISSVLRFQYKRINIVEKTAVYVFLLILSYSILSACIWFVIDFFFSTFLYGIITMVRVFENFPFSYFVSEIVKYVLIIITWSGIYFGVKYLLQWQSQHAKTEAAILRAEVAELKALRFQLNPHFLFNALSSLRTLVREDKIKAEEMLTKISEFLRYSLSSNNTKEVTLNDEIEALRNYIEIEKTKHGKKLLVNINISPLSEEYPIPILLLHPILENAIKYGKANEKEILQIDLAANVKNDWVEISIKNSGNWENHTLKQTVSGTKTGLKNVELRLNRYYPERNNLIIERKEDSVKVIIKYKKELLNEDK